MNPHSQTVVVPRKWLHDFVSWKRPSKRDWENGAVRDEFDKMQEQAKKLLSAAQPAGPAELGPYHGYRAQVLEEAARECERGLEFNFNDSFKDACRNCAVAIRDLKNAAPQVPSKAGSNDGAADASTAPSPARASSEAVAANTARALLQRWWDIYGGSTCDDKMTHADMEALDKETEAFLAQPEAGADSSK